MKVAIFGATGRVGQRLVERALADGHDVRALARDPAKLPARERLTVVQGDVTSSAPVVETIDQCDAVLSALGHTPNSPKDILTVATRSILDGMRQQGVRRFIAITGFGFSTPNDPPSLTARILVAIITRVARDLHNDGVGMYRALNESDREWVLIRSPRMTNEPGTGKYRSGFLKLSPSAKMSRADVVDFMLRELTDDTYLRRSPVVSN